MACGLDADIEVEIEGHVGYYCAGMNKRATVFVRGNASTGVAENLMSGLVVVDGNVSQSAGATGHGGLLVVRGDASARCGISMKGIDIVVGGSVGHMSAFMAQTGCLVVCGDAGEALGDSIYEARLYVRGSVAASAPTAWRRRSATSTARKLAGLLEAAGMEWIRRTFAATARRASSTTSTSTTRARTDVGEDRMFFPGPGTSASRISSIASSCGDPARFARGDLRHPRVRAKRRRCRTSTTSSSSAHRSPATRSRATVKGARPTSCSARFAQTPLELKIPVTIAGMSFGALSASAKEALGRGASEVGTSTTTGDGGMTNEERDHSATLVYQLPRPATA